MRDVIIFWRHTPGVVKTAATSPIMLCFNAANSGGDETLMLPLGKQLPDVQVQFHAFFLDLALALAWVILSVQQRRTDVL